MKKKRLKELLYKSILRLGWTNFSSLITLLLFIIFSLIFKFKICLFLLIFLVLFIHELGHFLAAKYLGYHNVRMVFFLPLGGMVTGSKQIEKFNERLIFILAGPIPGVLIGFILLISCNLFNLERLKNVAAFLILFNGFNLIPAYPLDGSKIMELLLMKNIRLQRLLSLLSTGLMTSIVIYTSDPMALLILLMTLYELLIVWFTQLKIKVNSGYYTIEWILKTNILWRLGLERGDDVRVLEIYRNPDAKYFFLFPLLYTIFILALAFFIINYIF